MQRDSQSFQHSICLTIEDETQTQSVDEEEVDQDEVKTLFCFETFTGPLVDTSIAEQESDWLKQKNLEFKFLSQESDGDDDPFKVTRSKVKKAPINQESSIKRSRNPGPGNPKQIKMGLLN